MARINALEKFDSLVEQGRVITGTFVMSTDPAVTAAVSSVGIDFVVIDREHGPNDIISSANHVRAAEANGTTPIIRVLTNDPSQIQASLDIGAHGVIVPKIGTVEDAKKALAATRYQPGGRGMCPAVEGARWASGETWFEHRNSSNENVLFIPLIETKQGVDNLADIVGLEGVNYVFFGFADLSQDLDLPGGMHSEEGAAELVRIWNDAIEVVHAAGAKIGGPIGYGFEGGDFGTFENDFMILTSQTKKLLNDFVRERESLVAAT